MNNITTPKHSQEAQEELAQRYKQIVDNKTNRFVAYKPFVSAFGDFEGMFLSILHELCRYDDWAGNTYEEWHRKYFNGKSPQAIQRSILLLEKAGLIESCQEKGFDKKKFYRPVEWAIAEAVAKAEAEFREKEWHRKFDPYLKNQETDGE